MEDKEKTCFNFQPRPFELGMNIHFLLNSAWTHSTDSFAIRIDESPQQFFLMNRVFQPMLEPLCHYFH